LKNVVPVRAMYGREAAHEATLSNLLQRRGYHSLDDVRAEGIIEGKAEAILAVLRARELLPNEEQRRVLLACRDSARLDRMLSRVVAVSSVDELLSA
jgi:hypothetical protein